MARVSLIVRRYWQSSWWFFNSSFYTLSQQLRYNLYKRDEREWKKIGRPIKNANVGRIIRKVKWGGGESIKDKEGEGEVTKENIKEKLTRKKFKR